LHKKLQSLRRREEKDEDEFRYEYPEVVPGVAGAVPA